MSLYLYGKCTRVLTFENCFFCGRPCSRAFRRTTVLRRCSFAARASWVCMLPSRFCTHTHTHTHIVYVCMYACMYVCMYVYTYFMREGAQGPPLVTSLKNVFFICFTAITLYFCVLFKFCCTREGAQGSPLVNPLNNVFLKFMKITS